MWDKARKILYRGGEILELLMAAAVVAGILVAMITLVPELARYWEHRTTAQSCDARSGKSAPQ